MEDGKIIVVCRFRPLNDKEQIQSKSLCVDFQEDQQTVSINSQYENGEDLTFTLDHIFPPSGSQEEVYQIAAKPIVNAVFQGFNGTVLAYGQTSSGKTYTMSGYSSSDPGIIPRLVQNLFCNINDSDDCIEFTVKISYCEIYLEKIKDLVAPQKRNLRIQEDKARGVHMPELTETYVVNSEEVLELMRIGAENREVSYTQMNATSSRSHSIFIITISQTNTKDYSAKTGRLYLVDLAGSEKVGKTGAAGKRLEEAKNINKSLTTLGQVIMALTDAKGSHVPYRDSKLTRVLQDSLGGNAKTALILTCSPSPWNEAETIGTLRFGIRAKAIKNKPKINKEYTVSELKLMLYAAREELKKKEKIIEELKGGGGEVNESREAEQSFSVLGFSGNEFSETVKELERVREQVANEARKSMRLQIEINEKQGMLERERRESEKLAAQMAYHKMNVKILEDEIGITEGNIKIHAVKIVKLEMDLDNNARNLAKSQRIVEEITKEKESLARELKNLKQQVLEYKILEAEHSKTKSLLEYEVNFSKSLQEELETLREKLEITVAKTPNIAQIKESIKSSIQHRERLRWKKERNKILADFEEYVKKVRVMEEEVSFCKESVVKTQQALVESEKAYTRKIQELEESNNTFRGLYEEANIRCAEAYAENQREKQRAISCVNKSEALEAQLISSTEKVCEMEQRLDRMQSAISMGTPSKNEFKGILGNHFKKTIKGGQQNGGFTPSPMKIIACVDVVSASVGKENFNNPY